MSETIVFFGSGPVAARSLELLHKSQPDLVVVTKPQPPHHREPFPVLALAHKLDLPVFTPNSPAELSDLFATKPVASRLGIVIDYGFVIGQNVIDYFPLGIINSHFSLLPKWRGADPISFAILNGDTETGVSLMRIVAALDEGPLLAQDKLIIPAGITTPQLTDKLIDMSNDLLKESLTPYIAGQLAPWPQDPSIKPSYSRKLTKQDGILDWTKPADRLEREIRAYTGWPRSRTKLFGKDVIITQAHAVPVDNPDSKPGDVETLKEGVIMIQCSHGSLCIDKLIPAGKQEMSAQAFLAGYKPA